MCAGKIPQHCYFLILEQELSPLYFFNEANHFRSFVYTANEREKNNH